MFSEYVKKLMNLNELLDKINSDIRTIMVNNLFFTWRWWLGLALTIVPWIIWFRIRKKDSTSRLLFAGFITLILSSYMDIVGQQLGLWVYYVDIEPINPSFEMFDFSLLPITTMLFLQYKPNISPIIKSVVYSVTGSFIIQPLFIFLKFYNPVHWKNFYSIPFLIVIYLTAHYCVTRKSFSKL